MTSLRFSDIFHPRGWNFGGTTPFCLLQGRIERLTVLTLRSLSALRVPTDLLKRFSSLPLLFVSGRFATL
ncbi:MAG TPA: hypothetical protein PKV65_01640, partial [Acidovorax defluvii]|nr:hypothetical protein [Acidovorax defluvii]